MVWISVQKCFEKTDFYTFNPCLCSTFFFFLQISDANHLASKIIPAQSNPDSLKGNLRPRPGCNLIYSINDRPPWHLCLLLGFQVRNNHFYRKINWTGSVIWRMTQFSLMLQHKNIHDNTCARFLKTSIQYIYYLFGRHFYPKQLTLKLSAREGFLVTHRKQRPSSVMVILFFDGQLLLMEPNCYRTFIRMYTSYFQGNFFKARYSI